MGKFISISQHNRIVAEIAAERDKAIRERIMAERNNDILDRIREAKRGPLENYVGHVLDDAAAEIERLRSRQTCGGDKPYVCHELATARSQLKAATKELDEASPMTRCDCCGCSFRLHKMVIEEGDRWECYPCWEALNEKERSK